MHWVRHFIWMNEKEKKCLEKVYVIHLQHVCLTKEGNWGCCPVQSAVRILHSLKKKKRKEWIKKICCPEHYKCDLHVFKCDRDGFQSIPLLSKIQSKEKLSLTILPTSSIVSTIICPGLFLWRWIYLIKDGNSCPDQTTCCSLKNGLLIFFVFEKEN